MRPEHMKVHKTLCALVLQCIDYVPAARPTFSEVTAQLKAAPDRQKMSHSSVNNAINEEEPLAFHEAAVTTEPTGTDTANTTSAIRRSAIFERQDSSDIINNNSNATEHAPQLPRSPFRSSVSTQQSLTPLTPRQSLPVLQPLQQQSQLDEEEPWRRSFINRDDDFD